MSIVKNTKVIVISIFIIFFFTQSKAELKFVFVDMDRIMKESVVGKSLLQQLDKADNKNKKIFSESRKNLATKRDKITSQKNILSKEEYEKKVIAINKEFEFFQSDAQKKVTLLRKGRDAAMKKILNELQKILAEYSKKNELTFIIDQKNIIIGRADLNITKDILKLLDAKIKKISLN
jgi:Skp family chaperone for outer membrane proteins|tara:strand:+ start:353 stop:886 length:534 start_codon:yes stop_codon:yes gene_type:complete